MLRPKRKIVISVHGIRTTGGWQKQIASVVSENGWIYYPLDYGYFSAIHFALPRIRKSRITWFCHQFDQIKERYPEVTPSVIAHSNGTYIVANALKTYPHIRVDKVILCGSIARPDFDWETIFERKQATLVRNEVGVKDIWAGHAHWLAWGDTGPSGQRGFTKDHKRLSQPRFPEFGHATFQAYGHYRAAWLPFLDEPMPYLGEEDPLWYAEEPVSPYDAARWSALTYYHQYIARVHYAIAHGEAFATNSNDPLPARCLWVLIPKTPGKAAKDAIIPFFQKHALKAGHAGKTDPRTFHYSGGEVLYDIPSTLNTLGFLDNRKDSELDGAVVEFQKWLERLIRSSRSQCADTVQVKRMEELPAALP
jgi:pimeloyl-ACP methyl ester carboxylesterase